MILRRGGYSLSDDPAQLDRALIHRWIHDDSYWAAGVPEDVQRRAIEHSLNFGVYDGEPGTRQVGYARVVTDTATFAWLCDVFVLEGHRGKGLATWLVEAVVAHSELQGLRNMMLGTRDAHSLYERFGFERVEGSGRYMRRFRPYRQSP